MLFIYWSDHTKSSRFNNESRFNETVRNEFNKRANSIIWFVSNCNSLERIKVASKIGQHYALTINGKCVQRIRGSYSTRKGAKQIEFDETICARDSQCELNKLQTSKFYLSFENQNCTSYITEKFWRSLNNNLIPIVMQPNREFYERIAPPNSFVHMEDFDHDVEKLTAYLNRVGTEFDLYGRYFEWKREFKAVYDAKSVEQFRICEFCARLNNQHFVENSYYSQISNWFNSACTRHIWNLHKKELF